MRPLFILPALAIASLAFPCCAVGPAGTPVRFDGQTNLIVWDAERKIEHFVRDARFRAKGKTLGFIAPSPTRPELSEADEAAFTMLAALEPRPREADGAATASGGMTTDAAGGVEVVEVRDVAGYRASVLRASDGRALAAWMRANGYEAFKGLDQWAEPYVRRGWFLTAFRVKGAATGPVRMSFRVPDGRPFNPYRVPAANAQGGLPLRLYYVSVGNESPRIGGKDAWRDPTWSAALPEATRYDLAEALRLPAEDLPKGAMVYQYNDYDFGQPDLDDLYFVPVGRLGWALPAAVALLTVAGVAAWVRSRPTPARPKPSAV